MVPTDHRRPTAKSRAWITFDKVVDIDQSPIEGRTPRSNPATCTGLFTPMRELFSPGAGVAFAAICRAFGFNVKVVAASSPARQHGIKVECASCRMSVFTMYRAGKRWQPRDSGDALQGRSIADVLAMTVEDALKLFQPVPALARKLQR